VAVLLLLARSDAGSIPATADDELRLLSANICGCTLDAGSVDFTVDLVSSCHIVSIPSQGGAVVAGEEPSTLIFTRSGSLDF
jgi:hypothetical protein